MKSTISDATDELSDHIRKLAEAIKDAGKGPDVAKKIADKLGIDLDRKMKRTPLFATKEEAKAGDTSEYDLTEIIEEYLGNSIK